MAVRVGFLGAGLIATYHSKSLRFSGTDVTWSGVYDPDGGRRDRFAAASGAASCASEDEVIAGSDAVYVCTWTSEHPRLVEAAATAGKAVFCEKPLAVDLADAEDMARVVRDAGVVNQVGLVLRHAHAFNLMRDLVAEPESGRVMNVIFRDDQYIPIQGMYESTWRADRTKAGAGTLLEHSIHDLDILEYVVGPLVSVSARSANFHGFDHIEDSVVSTLEFAAGGLGALTSVWHDLLERPSLRRVEIFCERLHVVAESEWFGPVRWQRPGEPPQCLEGEALWAEVEQRDLRRGNPDGSFIEAVIAQRPAWPSFDDAVRAHEVADAVYRSAADGAVPVECPARRTAPSYRGG